jgi:hypothetical protein
LNGVIAIQEPCYDADIYRLRQTGIRPYFYPASAASFTAMAYPFSHSFGAELLLDKNSAWLNAAQAPRAGE